MRTVVLRVDPCSPDGEVIGRAAEVIRGGGLVGFPTETVYGLAADALNPEAVRRVYEVKGRPERNPLPVQVASLREIDSLASRVPEVARRLMAAFFPGPLTLVLPASHRVPGPVTAGTGKVGVRMPDHPVALALLRAVGGPIVAPSANPSGEPPPVTAVEVAACFDGLIEMVLDAGPSAVGTASTVVDVTETPPRILRPGSISEEALTGFF